MPCITGLTVLLDPRTIHTFITLVLQEYLAEMPWLAVPFEERTAKDKLSDLFDVDGIPSLIILDEEDKVQRVLLPIHCSAADCLYCCHNYMNCTFTCCLRSFAIPLHLAGLCVNERVHAAVRALALHRQQYSLAHQQYSTPLAACLTCEGLWSPAASRPACHEASSVTVQRTTQWDKISIKSQ